MFPLLLDMLLLQRMSELITSAQESRKNQSEAKRRAIRRWLSPSNLEPDFYKYDYYQTLARRVPGTCDWFCGGTIFQEWRQSSIPILWIIGKPGCGKTVLSSAIVETIGVEGAQEDLHKVAHFQFKLSDEEKNHSLALVKSLIMQLVSFSDLVPLLNDVYEGSVHDVAVSPSLCGPLWSVLSTILTKLLELHIVIDAIDECRDMINCLGSMLRTLNVLAQDQAGDQTSRVKLILVSRMDQDILRVLNETSFSPYMISSGDTQKDIKLYLSNALATSYWLKKLPQNTQELISTDLAQRAEGMFLWIRLMIDELDKRQRSQAAVEHCLARLPKDLSECYHRIQSRLDPDDPDTTRVFQAMTTARKPLREAELVAILGIDPDTEHYTDCRKIEGPSSDWLYSMCGPIVEVQDDSVHFIHATAREHLLKEATAQFRIHLGDAHEYMALISLTYLLSNQGPDLSKPLVPRNGAMSIDLLLREREMRFLQYATLNWIHHLTSCTKPVITKLVQKILAFIQRPHCLTWLEAIFHICDHPAAYVNEAAARLSTFVSTIRQDQADFALAIRRWLGDLVHLVRDWNSVLTTDPANVHYIPADWFHDSSPIKQLLQSKMPYKLLALSSESIPNWNRGDHSGSRPEKVIEFFDPSMERCFVLLHHHHLHSLSLRCQSSETDLVLGDINLKEDTRKYGGKGLICQVHLEKAAFSMDHRYLACLLRGQWHDYNNYIFETYLIDLESSESYSRILSPVQWSNTFHIESVEIPRHSYHRCLESVIEADLLDPGLGFSSDSSKLFTPGGTWDVATGQMEEALFERQEYLAITFCENGAYAAALNSQHSVEVWEISQSVRKPEPIGIASPAPWLPKLVAVSPKGRFIAMWLFEPKKDWTHGKTFSRWFQSAQLAMFDTLTQSTSILCDAKDTLRSSPFTGAFSGDECKLLVLSRGERQNALPLLHETKEMSPKQKLSAITIQIFSFEGQGAGEMQWTVCSTFTLPGHMHNHTHPPAIHLDSEHNRIGISISNGLRLMDLVSGRKAAAILDSSDSASSAAFLGPNVCGIATSQDHSKVVVLSNAKSSSHAQKVTEDELVAVEGQSISVPAVMEYLEYRKHVFASREEVYDKLSELFTQYRNESAISSQVFDEIASILEPLPNMAHNLANELLKGAFTVPDMMDADAKIDHHTGNRIMNERGVRNDSSYSVCSIV